MQSPAQQMGSIVSISTDDEAWVLCIGTSHPDTDLMVMCREHDPDGRFIDDSAVVGDGESSVLTE